MPTYRLQELEDGVDSVCNLVSVTSNLYNTVCGQRTALGEDFDHCTGCLFTPTHNDSLTITASLASEAIYDALYKSTHHLQLPSSTT